jgi:multidrug resistance efflux pump
MIAIGKKQVGQAQARRNEVKNQYNYLNIKAPNNGVVISKNINVGEMAMPGMPAIVLSDLSDLKVSVDVAESDLQKFAYGKKVKVDIPSAGITSIGKVTAIIPNSNPMTHSFKIKVSFNPNHKVVYPGMYATVTAE